VGKKRKKEKEVMRLPKGKVAKGYFLKLPRVVNGRVVVSREKLDSSAMLQGLVKFVTFRKD
jgi:hypothetical protein